MQCWHNNFQFLHLCFQCENLLSDRQTGHCYDEWQTDQKLLQRIASETNEGCVTAIQYVFNSDPALDERWLAPSLKQSHYKVDMTSVTPAIITGQDSWPLPVMEHVAISRNVTHCLVVEPRSKRCFIMVSIVPDSKGFVSCCKFFERNPKVWQSCF